MVAKQRISFSGTPREIELKKRRVSIQLKILNSKSKKEEMPLQRQLSNINRKLRELR